MKIPVAVGRELLDFFWPEFAINSGCIYRKGHEQESNKVQFSGTATDWECFVNHTHILDEFGSRGVLVHRETVSEDLDAVECSYEEQHPDFISACEIGRAIAKVWATKLRLDFPGESFRVYYTQYDNPIVRFHKVRDGEPVWLDNETLQKADSADFRCAVVYDTRSLEHPVWNYQLP